MRIAKLARLALIAPFALAASARAAPLHAGLLDACAQTSAASAQASPDGFSARGLHIALNAGPASPTLDAATLHLSQLRGDLDADALGEAATAAAVALLQQAFLATHPHAPAPCPSGALGAALQKLQGGLLQGGAYAFTWTNVTLRDGGNGTHVGTMSLRAERHGPQVDARIDLRGIAPVHPLPDMRIPSPQNFDLEASGPADRLAAALSGGLGGSETIPFTLSGAHLTLGESHFALSGHGAAGANPQAGRFSGTLTARNFDAAVEAVSAIPKLRTALYLARFAAKQDGDQLVWNLEWSQGLLFVNNVPLPLR